jgi:hypothetical protein
MSEMLQFFLNLLEMLNWNMSWSLCGHRKDVYVHCTDSEEMSQQSSRT